MQSTLKVITFLSGRGSNFKCLLDYQKNQSPRYDIIAVYSDKPEAAGLAYARDAGIPVHAFSRAAYSSFAAFKQAIFEHADNSGADLVALAGYMQIVPEWFINRWQGKIINIHPSLLPKFPGLDTHRRVIEAGETLHGCTVHYVDAGVDTGPIIAQAKVPVEPSDTPELLAARVLVEEHKLYPWVLSQIALENISLSNGRAVIAPSAQTNSVHQNWTLY